MLVLAMAGCSGGHDRNAVATPISSPIGPAPVLFSDPSRSGPGGSQHLAGCANASIDESPLTDMQGMYKGERGGLYPGGSNSMPGSHLSAGIAMANRVRPLDPNGNISTSGRYVLLAIGMSNTGSEFEAFRQLAQGDPSRNPQLVAVNGSQGGMTADQWASPSCPCWFAVDQQLAALGLTRKQVAVAWVKLANPNPTQPYPGHAVELRDDIVATLQNMKFRYPNLKLAYLSSRIYGGYATSTLNPEPYAYESGFVVRRVIAAQLSGAPGTNFDPARGRMDMPWIAWGPYLWADGLTPRSDGLTWNCTDLSPVDGTHPSDTGSQKVADQLLSFVKSDPTASIWFSQ
jgi:hypothetical protein